MTKPISWYAERYTSIHEMSLVPIEPGLKFPQSKDWGNNVLSDPEKAIDFYSQNADWNMGCVLGPSGFCSLDIDCAESFALILEEYGIPLDALKGYPTIQGSDKGYRVMFRVPDNTHLDYQKMSWPKQDDKTKQFTVFELRAGCDGKQRQDVLPPSIHPETKRPYKWIVQPAKTREDWPTPPGWLLAIWESWDSFKPQIKQICPWAEKQPAPENKPKTVYTGQDKGADVIGEYNRVYSLVNQLERYGYTRKGNRYLSPHSGTNLPGVCIFPGGDTCWIHHASDPLCSDDSGQPVNSFDLFCYYDHGNDASKAVKAAADELGIKPKPRAAKPAPVEITDIEEETPLPQDTEQSMEPIAPFRCLGIDEGRYYYLPKSTQQVTAISAGTHTNKSHLLSIAPLEWYETEFQSKTGVDWTQATNSLMRWSEQKGTFDPARIRGRGAWFDSGRSVLHLGDRLMVDGADVELIEHRTRFIYEKKPPIEALRPEGHIHDAEAAAVVAIANMLNWQKPVNATLFAGWLTLAPICGALSWRPHIWLTGQRGTGKSWVIDNIVSPMLGGTALTVQSNSTEAGIRQRLKQDARPVVFDEAEGENQHARSRMQAVLELARQASSDGLAEIAKGTAGGNALSFKVRSMFMMGSINVGLAQASDKSRFTVLSLVKAKAGGEGRAQFESLEKAVNETLTRDYCAALRARTYRLIPVIRKNAKVLSKVAAEHIGNQRAGDQLGALLAGAWSLHSSIELDLNMARKYVEGHDWGLDQDEAQESDERALSAEILHAQIRFDTVHGPRLRAISELVQRLVDPDYEDEIKPIDAENALARHGIKCQAGCVIVSESHPELRRILKDTPWGGGWGRVLERIPGAEKMASIRFAGLRHRAIRMPIDEIM